MTKQLITTLAAATLLGSCQKNNSIPANPEKVDIKMDLPRPGSVYNAGDTVRILANISYYDQLHGYEVKIEDTTSGFVLFDAVQYIHGEQYTIDEKWVCTNKEPATLKLTVITVVDHNGTEARRELAFDVQP